MAKLSKSPKKKTGIVVRRTLLNESLKNPKKIVSQPIRNKVLPIPKGYHSITPYLIVNNGKKAIEFYKKAFGAKVIMRMEQPGNKISHAELKIGDSKIMLADEFPEMCALSPTTVGGTPITIHYYTKQVDKVVKKAVAAGAILLRPIADMFYGDRSGMVEDPYGHKWNISTHIEDVTPAKMKKRAAALFGKKASK